MRPSVNFIGAGAAPIRALALGLLATLLAQSGQASASIPPPLALLVLSEDPATEAITVAYAALLTASANFIPADAPVARWQLQACLKQDAEAAGCIAQALAARPGRVQPVVLLSTRRRDDVYEWRCVGADPARSQARRRISIDLREAMFGTPTARAAARDAALGCLFDAAADAEGRITPRP